MYVTYLCQKAHHLCVLFFISQRSVLSKLLSCLTLDIQYGITPRGRGIREHTSNKIMISLIKSTWVISDFYMSKEPAMEAL